VMSRSKNAVDATVTRDGPANTLADRPSDAKGVHEIEKDAEDLGSQTKGDAVPATMTADGPATAIDDKPTGAKGVEQLKQTETKDPGCKDCE